MISYLQDKTFLKRLDKEHVKNILVRIILLDKDETPIKSIEGRISGGNMSINGNSAIRRSGSISFVAEETKNDLSDIDNLLTLNKKIKMDIGVENNIDNRYDDIIWFKQGIFLITQLNFSHSNMGVQINLSLQDKMALLNGTCGGGLPASVTFDSYDQIYGTSKYNTFYDIDSPNTYTVYESRETEQDSFDFYIYSESYGFTKVDKSLIGTRVTIKQTIFDIIQTLVCNYGGEDIAKIIINDIPRELKQSVRYVGDHTLYYNVNNNIYTQNQDLTLDHPSSWRAFNYNEDCGYIYTDFVFPGDLISSIGDNVCSILDKIKNELGNYEYFYDIDGNFVFQEIKNYLNTSYSPIQKRDENGYVLDNQNYYVDFSGTTESIYSFLQDSELVISYSNSPKYENIKNDFHIWGGSSKSEGDKVIHYHIAIKEKPKVFSTWMVVDEYIIDEKTGAKEYTGKVYMSKDSDETHPYTPTDWRAELYLRGLQKKVDGMRPDIYEQELLDLFDSIYNMREKRYYEDDVNCPNNLAYWIDFLEPVGDLQKFSVDTIGPRVYSYNQDNIKKIYNKDFPNVIMVNTDDSLQSRKLLIAKCEEIGQSWTNVTGDIGDRAVTALGINGYSAQEVARNLLYQYISVQSAISLSIIPIFYLEPNSRITVEDEVSKISGDYIVNSINFSFGGNTPIMNLSCSQALERY